MSGRMGHRLYSSEGDQDDLTVRQGIGYSESIDMETTTTRETNFTE